ncbi:hypothetical protein ABZP36_032295 [Zizania latifolia]
MQRRTGAARSCHRWSSFGLANTGGCNHKLRAGNSDHVRRRGPAADLDTRQLRTLRRIEDLELAAQQNCLGALSISAPPGGRGGDGRHRGAALCSPDRARRAACSASPSGLCS